MSNWLASMVASARWATRRSGGLAAIVGLLVWAPNLALGGYNLFMTPVSDPGTVPLAGDTGLNDPSLAGDWVSYILGVSSDDGSRIGAVDVDLKGIFHQRWNWDEDAQTYGSTPSGLGISGGDSHLLPMNGALFAVQPTENIHESAPYGTLPDVPGSIDYGVGTRMKGVWGIPGANSTSFDLAYVVIPRGYESQLEYAIDVADPFGEVFNFRQGASFPAPPPKPLPLPIPDPLPPPASNPIPPVTTLPPTVPPPVVPPPAPLGIPQLNASATQMLWSSDNGLPAGFTAYQLSVSLLDGSLIGAVDVRIDAPLHQSWTDLDADGVVDPSPRGPATSGADSHLLIPGNALTMPLAEDNNVGASPFDTGSGSAGVGSHLGGAWGNIGAEQSDSAQLAYIVVPDDLNFQDLDLTVGLVARQGDSFSPLVNLAANNFAVLGADCATISSSQPIELPPVVAPPIVDLPQPPIVHEDLPTVGDPPPAIDVPPMIEFPPSTGDPPGEPVIVVIDDVDWHVPTTDPWLYVDVDVPAPDQGDVIFARPGLVHGSGYWTTWNLDGLVLNSELIYVGGLGTPVDDGSGVMVATTLISLQKAVVHRAGGLSWTSVTTLNSDGGTDRFFAFSDYDLAGQSALASSTPEPSSAALVFFGSCIAACWARARFM